MIPRTSKLPGVILAVAAVVLTAGAGLMLFSTFMLYDDEGYVLFSLKNFAEHGALYRDVYSQYGPLPYVIFQVLHWVGVPFTHTAGRLITLGLWAAAAGLCCRLVWRATRHLALSLSVLAGTYVYLWIMVSEPNHPGGWIALIVALLAALGYAWLIRGKLIAWSALVGAAVAALLLTKINVGVFAGLSAVMFLVFHAKAPAWSRIGGALLAVLLVVMPFALMRSLLAEHWVRMYAALFALAALPIALSTRRAATASALKIGLAEFGAMLGGAMVVLALTLGTVLARGTSARELLDGMLLAPLQHPTHFSLEFHWPSTALAVAIISAALFAFVFISSRNGSSLPGDRVVAAARVAVAIALAAAVLQFPYTSPNNVVFAHAISCLWVLLWPLSGEPPERVAARAWIVLLAMGQWLHPFPVPGSQIAWGTFLMLPLGGLGAWESFTWWHLSRREAPVSPRYRSVRLAGVAALIVIPVLLGMQLLEIGARYLGSRSLALPGAETLRLPDNATATYRILSLNAVAHTDMLFSLPGMFSFNLWTGLPAPTHANVTHWFSLLNETQQREIIRALASHPRSGVIVQTGHLEFLKSRGLAARGPLYDYIMANYASAFEIDDFEFRVRRERTILPLLTADFLLERPDQTKRDAFDALLKIDLLLVQPVGSVVISSMDGSSAPLVLDAHNSRIEITPMTMQGKPAGAARAAKFPFTPSGPTELSVYFPRNGYHLSLAQTLITVRDPNGAELAMVRLRP